MARGVNKVILVGNVGQDPEVKSTQSGSQVVNISLATTEEWKDKETGDKKEKTEWHRVVAFGRLAEIIAQYVVRGSKLYIDGFLRTRKWQNNDGVDQYTTEIVMKEFQMLDSSQRSDAGGNHQQPRPVAPPTAPRQSSQQFDTSFDDDLPF